MSMAPLQEQPVSNEELQRQADEADRAARRRGRVPQSFSESLANLGRAWNPVGTSLADYAFQSAPEGLRKEVGSALIAAPFDPATWLFGPLGGAKGMLGLGAGTVSSMLATRAASPYLEEHIQNPYARALAGLGVGFAAGAVGGVGAFGAAAGLESLGRTAIARPGSLAGRVLRAPAYAMLGVVPPGGGGGKPRPPPFSDPDPVIQDFTRLLHSPESADLSRLTLDMRKAQLAQRVAALQARAEQLLTEGATYEEAVNKARSETMSGAFDRPLTAISEVMASRYRDALFARVHQVLAQEPLEHIATVEALTNALQGKGIPRIVGTKGGSAYTRLSRVFPPEVIDAIKQRRNLEDTIQQRLMEASKTPQMPLRGPQGQPWVRIGDQFFERTSEGKLVPVEQGSLVGPEALNPDMQVPMFPQEAPAGVPNLPRNPNAQRELDLLKLELAHGPTDLGPPPVFPERGILAGELQPPLIPREQLSFWQKEAAAKPLGAYEPPTPYRIEQMRKGRFDIPLPAERQEPALVIEAKRPGLTGFEREDKNILIRAAREAGLTVADTIGLVRANISSVDFSWWRQQKAMILAHFPDFVEANVAAWQTAFPTKRSYELAKASELRIKQSRYYQYYAEAGYDFLRSVDQKGLPDWQRTEQFLVVGGERPIQKFALKVPWIRASSQAFVTGTNEMNWKMFTHFVDDQFKLAEKIGSGQVKTAKSFDMQGNIRQYAAMLADMTGRGMLNGKVGKWEYDARGVSGILNALMFAARNTWGNAILVRHLASGSSAVRGEAWKNIISFVGGTMAVLAAGEQMGLWVVQKNSLSSDYGKVRRGPNRDDPWGGEQQYAVLMARLVAEEGKSPRTGRVYDKDRLDIIKDFLRTKSSPGLGFLLDVSTGKTSTGERTDLKSWEQWVDRLAPMTLNSFRQAMAESGIAGAPFGMASAVGQGTSTFEYKIGELHDQWEKGINAYSDIPANDLEAKAKGLRTRDTVREAYPELEARLFITGYVTSFKTDEAKAIALRLMKENNVPIAEVQGLLPGKENGLYDSEARKRLRRQFIQALGEQAIVQKKAA